MAAESGWVVELRSSWVWLALGSQSAERESRWAAASRMAAQALPWAARAWQSVGPASPLERVLALARARIQT